MDKTIILSELSKTIAELTECTPADAENFVRELFVLAAERLESDGEVSIPELGLFKLTADSIEFAPDSGLAAAINAPFSAFEAVELPDDFQIEDESESETMETYETEEDAVSVAPSEPEKSPEPEPEIEPESELKTESEYEPESEPMSEPESESPKRGYGWILWLLVCALCFAAGWYFGGRHAVSKIAGESEAVDDKVSDADVLADSIDLDVERKDETVVEPLPEPIPQIPIVTDTIAPGRFLTTMAREHYGQMDYWVYIYEDNAANLGHPDRLSAGTVVIIPPAEKYSLQPGDASKISEASRLANEIYGRFN